MPNYQDAVTRLNRMNLQHLWLLSTALSIVDMYDSEGVLFPTLSFERVRLLDMAILDSRALSYKSSRVTSSDFTYILNGLLEATDHLFDEVHSRGGGNRDEDLFVLNKAFARLLTAQRRFQELDMVGRTSRLMIMYEIIPKKYLDMCDARSRVLVRELPRRIETAIGMSILEFAAHWVMTATLYKDVGEKIVKVINRMHRNFKGTHFGSALHRHARVLNLFVQDLQHVEGRMEWGIGGQTPEEVARGRKFIGLASRSTREMRDIMASNEVYRAGKRGLRMSVLERYPYVRLTDNDESATYCIPDLRVHARALEDVLHFSVQDVVGNDFNVARGEVLEVYLQLLMNAKYPESSCVREREYRRGAETVRGPDMTFVERNSGRLIVIEAKARRMRGKTRVELDPELIDANLIDVYGAILKAEEKVRELFADIPEYEDCKEVLDTCKGGEVICVVVTWEDVAFLSQALRFFATHRPGHSLQRAHMRFCVMSVELFERAVVGAVRTKRLLAHVLDEFWEDSGSLEPGGSAPELFRGLISSIGLEFATTFAKDREWGESEPSG